MSMTQAEKDYRLQCLNSLLVTPHRNREGTGKDDAARQVARAELNRFHDELLEKDPIFYGKLGYWYLQNGRLRDHQETFIANMFISPMGEHRDAAYMVLSEGENFAPYQVERLLRFVRDTKHKRLPRCMRTATLKWFDRLQENPKRFDGAALQARKQLQYIARTTHARMLDRANGILFTGEYPEDSPFAAMRDLSRNDCEPQVIAEALIKHSIPLRICAPFMKKLTPTVMLAVINNMSPAEVINNMGWLQERGVLDNASLKSLVQAKLKEAETSKRVAGLKTRTAVSTGRIKDVDILKQMETVGNKQIKRIGVIKRPTALFVDKSGSMHSAILLGTQIGAVVAQAIEQDVFFGAYMFDTGVYDLGNPGQNLSDWEQAVKNIHAGGGTSIGGPLVKLMRDNKLVEQIIVITDGGDNTPPRFETAYAAYKENMKVEPMVTFIHLPGEPDRLSGELQNLGCEFRKIEGGGDQYSLPEILTLLSRPSMFDLVMEIMDIQLPKRAA